MTERRTTRRAAAVARRVPLSFGRELFWRDVTENMVRLSGLPRPVRMVAGAGFVLLLAMTAALLFNGVWREFPLLAQTIGQPGRGTLRPEPVLPVTLFVISVAFAFMLTGALSAGRAVAVAALVPFLSVAGGWAGLVRGFATGGGWQEVVGWAALALIPVWFGVRRYAVRRRDGARPALDFAVALLLIAAVLATAQERLVTVDRLAATGSSSAVVQVASTLTTLAALVVPLVLVLGADIASFAHRLGDWTVTLVREALSPRLLGAMFAAVLAAQLALSVMQVRGDLAQRPFGAVAGEYAGAAVVPVLVALVWWLTMVRGGRAERLPDGDEVTGTGKAATLRLVAIYTSLGVVGVLTINAMQSLITIAGIRPDSIVAIAATIRDVVGIQWWTVVVSCSAVAAALWLRRAGRRTPALLTGLIGALWTWNWLTGTGRPLSALHHSQDQVNVLLVAATAALAGWWLARRRLDVARATALVMVLVMTFLLGQTHLLAQPFAPVLGFSAVGLVCVGLLWDILTFGPWVNRDTPRLPRVSRLFIYVGYCLFGVAVINWSLAAHDLGDVELYTGGGAALGFEVFGLPLIYGVLAAGLAASTRPPPTGDSARGAEPPGDPVDA